MLALDKLEIERLATHAFEETPRRAYIAGVCSWNHASVAPLFQSPFGAPVFCESVDAAIKAAAREDGVVVGWASRTSDDHEAAAVAAGVPLIRIEDGFLRSVGLGAGFMPAASFAVDRRGIYYDARRVSDLEHLLQTAHVDDAGRASGARLREAIVAARLSKYNLSRKTLKLDVPKSRRVVFVPGQVSDDASIRQTVSRTIDVASGENVNLQLLRLARARAPEAFIIFKPHPDVAAGLREGRLSKKAMSAYADLIADGIDVVDLIEAADEVETITSLAGFEALLRKKPVIVHGMPFYAGWGLTEDRAHLARRTARRTLDEIIYLAFDRYTRHVDPVTHKTCDASALVSRLLDVRKSPMHRARARVLQGAAWGFERWHDLRGGARDRSAEGRPPKQTFLFLQGHPSPFTKELAGALERAGCRTLRVNFCVGDRLYWLGQPAISYRGSLEAWPEFLRGLIAREGVTDILYYGDGKPYHVATAKVARTCDVRTFAYEFGYLRPDWLTLERGGMSGRSHFPSDPEAIRAIGAKFDEPDLVQRYSHTIGEELRHEMLYHFSSYFLHALFPRYAADRYYNPVVEYVTGIPKSLSAARRQAHAVSVTERLIGERARYFLFPLQLQCDYQLRRNSPFRHQSDAIDKVVRSFAAHAPDDALLVFKCHPLDNGAEGWERVIAARAAAAGVGDRVHYIDGGNLSVLLQHAKGLLTINSTAGMHALVMGRPVVVLGDAVYDIQGMTHKGCVDTFWASPEGPDPGLLRAFVRALAGTIQVKGSFFDKAGREAAIATFVERLTQGRVNGEGAFVDVPPRRAKTA